MKTFLKLVLGLACTLNFTTTEVYAQVQTGGAGGDPNCQDFYSKASEATVALAKLGQAEVNKINPLINIAQLRSVFDQNVKYSVVPGTNDNLNGRLAWSDPKTMTTYLSINEWRNLDQAEQFKIVSHELLVLVGVENDGEYSISNDMFAALKTTTLKRALGPLSIQDYVENTDGSTTISEPTIYRFIYGINRPCKISKKSSADGVCKYFGFTKSMATIYYKINTGLAIIVNIAGHQSGEVTKRSKPFTDFPVVDYISNITCN